jgi:hypothetical protein
MKYLRSFSVITKTIILLTVLFLFYGYLCRLAGIYFFWESKTIGWLLFWLMAISILYDRLKIENKGKVPKKIGIGISIFIFLITSLILVIIPQTSAYDNAVSFIKTNSNIEKSIGKVKSVVLVPPASISVTTNNKGTAGQANLHFIVKGAEKYMDLNVLMGKDFDTDWQIEIVE